MPRAIPERDPISDVFDGLVLEAGGAQALAVVTDAGADVIARGALIVRYAVHYLGVGKTTLTIVPGLLALDYGEFLTGEAAWEFLLKRSNLYPRSEVIGYRNDGKDDMVFIRSLDLAQPVEVLVYGDAAATLPLARPTALIAPAGAALPARLLEYLPRYDSVAAWQAEVNR